MNLLPQGVEPLLHLGHLGAQDCQFVALLILGGRRSRLFPARYKCRRGGAEDGHVLLGKLGQRVIAQALFEGLGQLGLIGAEIVHRGFEIGRD